jgi:hypothetical protein
MSEKQTPITAMSDEERRVYAQQQIRRQLAKFFLVKIGVSAAVFVACRIISNKLMESVDD